MAAGRRPHAGSLQPRKQGTRQATGVPSQTTCSGAQSRGVNIVAGAGMELGGPAGAAQRRAPALGRRSRDAPGFTPNRRGVPKILAAPPHNSAVKPPITDPVSATPNPNENANPAITQTTNVRSTNRMPGGREDQWILSLCDPN